MKPKRMHSRLYLAAAALAICATGVVMAKREPRGFGGPGPGMFQPNPQAPIPVR